MVVANMDIQPIVDYFNTGQTVYYFKGTVKPQTGFRVAIYIRVSTKLQEHKFSLRAQIQELTRYADQTGWDTIAIYRDVDSGGKLDKKGLSQMLDDVEDGTVDVVLCIEQDRLSRLDTVAWEYLKSQLRENNVKIAEPGSITDLTNEDDEFISDIKNLIAKRGKRAVVKTMMRGKRQRTREGKGWGKCPWEYTYDKNTGCYSINEAWSWVIDFIDNLVINGDEQGIKLNDTQIAARLSAKAKTPSGKDWGPHHIRQRLTSKAYHGVFEKAFANGETVSKPDIYPKLRNELTWEKIQTMRNKKHKDSPATVPHILRNITTTCGYCGRQLSIKQSRSTGSNPLFYFQHEHKLPPACSFSMNSLRIEFNLDRAFNDILDSADSAAQYIQFDYLLSDMDKAAAELAAVNELLQSTQDKLDNLLALYIDPDNAFSKDALNKMKSGLQAERTAQQVRKTQLESLIAAVSAPLLNYATVHDYLSVNGAVDLRGYERLERITRLISSGVLYENKYVLQGHVSSSPLQISIPVSPNPFGHKK